MVPWRGSKNRCELSAEHDGLERLLAVSSGGPQTSFAVTVPNIDLPAGVCLSEKYTALLGMRRRAESRRTCLVERPAIGPAADASVAVSMRRLAAHFPGALRELDRVSTSELLTRRQSCGEIPQPSWVLVVENYHYLWRCVRRQKSGFAIQSVSENFRRLRGELVELTERIQGTNGVQKGGLNDWVLAHAGAAEGVSADQVRALFDGRAQVSRFSAGDPNGQGGVGLCHHCEHRRSLRSARGSEFHRCGLYKTDPRRKKYPPLPVVACSGYSFPREGGPVNPRVESTSD